MDLFEPERRVDPELALRSLTEAARLLGYEVRTVRLGDEEGDAASGACRVRGNGIILLDRRLDTVRRGRVLARLLAEVDDGTRYLPPLAREAIDRARERP